MKKYIVIISVFVILILATSIFFHVTKKDIKLDNVEIKKEVKNNMFAMYKKVNGNYVEITDNVFPSEGYVLNTTESKCTDNNGNVVPNILSYNDTTKKVVVDTDKTVFCYLYFDTVEYTITLIMNDGTFSSTPSGWIKSGNNYTRSYNIETNTFSLPTPTRSRYDFNGWYNNSSFTGSQYTNVTKGTTGNKIYYAKWDASKYYLVKNGVEQYEHKLRRITEDNVIQYQNYIQVKANTTSSRAYYYFDNIDLTSFSKLCVDIEVTIKPYDALILAAEPTVDTLSGSQLTHLVIVRANTLPRTTMCLDISNVQGIYNCIGIFKNSATTASSTTYNIYNLWLE